MTGFEMTGDIAIRKSKKPVLWTDCENQQKSEAGGCQPRFGSPNSLNLKRTT
jgi:hypothetical protein